MPKHFNSHETIKNQGCRYGIKQYQSNQKQISNYMCIQKLVFLDKANMKHDKEYPHWLLQDTKLHMMWTQYVQSQSTQHSP
jgi:hypothetical protein